MSDEVHSLLLSSAERALFLERLDLPPGIAARLRFAVHLSGCLEVSLPETDLVQLLQALAEVMTIGEDGEMIAAIEGMTERNGMANGEETEDTDEESVLADFPNEVLDQVREFIKAGDFETPEEAFAAVEAFMEAHNSQPVDDFCGLAPVQVYELLNTAWSGPDAVISLSAALTSDDLKDSAMAQNGLRFLQYVSEEGAIRLTARKNMNRKAVLALIRRTEWPRFDRARFEEFHKAPNEEDHLQLNVLRVLLEFANYIKLQKGQLTLTKKGQRCLEQATLGDLQVDLFLQLYTELNLAYLDPLPEYPEVQSTVPFIFFVIHELAAEAIAIDALCERVYLSPVREGFQEAGHPTHDDFALTTRILNPLHDFGLLEQHKGPSVHARLETLQSVKLTPLFKKMIRFHIPDPEVLEKKHS